MKNIKIFIQIIVIQLITFTSAQTYQFTNCGQAGHSGPSQAQCDSEYGSGVVTVADGIQHWTVPSSGNYTLEVMGASGGNFQGYVGLGAKMQGDIELVQGQILQILVGQEGNGDGNDGGSGGGGSFVATSDDIPLVIAGGGAGGYNNGPENHGLTTECGGDGSNYPGSGGCDGNGGSDLDNSNGTPAGGCFYTDGGCDDCWSGVCGVGKSFINGGEGGYCDNDPSRHFPGGFGGGAEAWRSGSGGAAGGGYSGGGAQQHSGGTGGGGGSFISPNAALTLAQSGVNEGHGSVTITFLGPNLPDPITSIDITGTSGYRMLSSPVSGTVYADLLYELWTQGMAGSDDPDIGGANVWTFFNNEWGGWWNPLIDLTTDDYTAGSGVLVYVYADTDFDGNDDLPVTLSVGNASATLVFSDGATASYALHNVLHTDEQDGSIYYEIESGTLTLSDGVTIINVDGGGYCRNHGTGRLLWDGGMLTSDVFDENCNSYAFDVMNPSEDMNTIFSNGGSAEFADGSYYNAWEGSGSSTVTIILDAIEADDYDSDISISTSESAWNLLGNPYPWAVDISQLAADNPNYNSTVYIWDNATSAYRIHNGQTGDIADGLISPFQGFWIYSNSGTNFTFTEASLSGNTGTNYRTTTDDSNGSAVFTFTNGGYSSSTYLSFTPEGHINLDQADASRLLPMSSMEHLTSMIHESGKSLSINNLPLELSNDISFPMDVMMLSPTEDGYETMAEQVNLTWDITNLPAGMTLELKNNITGQNINLTGYPSAYINLPSKGGFLMSEDFLATYPVVGDAYFTVSVNATLAGQGDDDIILPEQLVLHNAYPNPFNPSTLIRFDLSDADMVSLDIFDLNGKQVSSLISEYMIPGSHQISWNPGNLPSGVYIAKLSTGNTSLNQKITYIK